MPPSQTLLAPNILQPYHLTRRADRPSPALTVGIIFIASLAIVLIFCAIVTIFICKNNAAQKRRNKALQEQNQSRATATKHNYHEVDDIEIGISELDSSRQTYMVVSYPGVELQGDTELRGEEPLEVDGFVAAAPVPWTPVELPPETYRR